MKKCIALLLAMTMLMSGTSVFAKTTESFAFKENLSFDAAVKEADETFDAVQKEVEIFNFLSDYAAARHHPDAHRQSGLHWNFFLNCPCLCCRRHECHLSD